MAENLSNDIQTALNGAISDSVTSITTLGSTGFPAVNFRVRVDDEIMLVTSVGGGTNWTVTRGAEGTIASAHGDTIAVVHVLTAGGIVQYVAENGGYSIGAHSAIRLNDQLIDEDLTIPASTNGSTTGPVTINTGKTVTITTGSYWVILGV